MKLASYVWVIGSVSMLASMKPAFADFVSIEENAAEISKEALSLDCDPSKIAKQIIDQKGGVVPSHLHHFGPRKFLDEDIQARTIPKAAWDQFIMGAQSRFGHLPVRRGLYGTAGIDSNGFGNGAFAFNNNWLMEIVVDDSCRTPDVVATLDILSKDKRFQSWFASQKGTSREGFVNLRQYTTKCDGKMSMTGFIDAHCDKLVERFLTESKIRVIQDDQLEKSFYIRDQSCIRSILGSPDEMIRLLADRDYWWMKPCGADLASEYIPYYLAASLKEASKPVDPEILAKIDRNIDRLANTKLRPQVRNLLNTYRHCALEGKLEQFQQQIDETAIRNADPGTFHWDVPESYCK